MPLDQTTETISHFIGVFHLTAEEMRLRDQYEVFKAEKAAQDAARTHEITQVKVKNGHDLKPFEPGVKYAPVTDPLLESQAVADASIPATQTAAPFFGVPLVEDVGGWLGSFSSSGMILLPFVPIPSSLVTVTLQSITLFDNDVIGFSDDSSVVDLEQLYLDLTGAAAVAAALGGYGSGLVDPILALHPDFAEVLKATVDGFELPEIEGATVAVLDKEELDEAAADADGPLVISGGEVLSEPVEIEDLLPAYLAEKRAEAEAEAEAKEAEDGTLAAKHEDDTPNPYTVAAGHQVVTGANEATNEVNLTTSWIDAGVIVVGGDMTNATMISQVNVLSDNDTGSGFNIDAPSTTMNVAQFLTPSSNPDVEGEAAIPASFALPSVWNIERIESDVVLLNSFSQFSFAMDADVVDYSISASATFIGTGENLLFNYGQALQIGFGYDLIIVGGDMMNATVISQTNVLLDDDDTTVSMNSSISGHDNLLLNHVSIEKHGTDAFEDMQDSFADALDDLADGAEDIASDVAQNPLFNGLDALSVLYVAGNLIKVTSIAQTNIFGDQDQVSEALDDFVDDTEDAVEVITGSNSLINSVNIVDLGFDSTVMVGGDTYDDALLYQAELVDTDASPLGVELSALANEAVAFLADDMLLPEYPGASGDGENGYGGTASDAGSQTADVMQSMTA